MARTHAFKEVKLTKTFERSFRRLGSESQEQCKEALKLLVRDPLSSGLHMKPIRPNNVYYEARTDRGDRLVIYPVGNTAYVMDVVDHDRLATWGHERAPERT